jgi:hypothetical protein
MVLDNLCTPSRISVTRQSPDDLDYILDRSRAASAHSYLVCEHLA